MLLAEETCKIGDLVKYKNDFGYLEDVIGARYFVDWIVCVSEMNVGYSTETEASLWVLRKEYLEWEQENMK